MDALFSRQTKIRPSPVMRCMREGASPRPRRRAAGAGGRPAPYPRTVAGLAISRPWAAPTCDIRRSQSRAPGHPAPKLQADMGLQDFLLALQFLAGPVIQHPALDHDHAAVGEVEQHVDVLR